ncbi:MAG: M28 family peptidase [Gemmataceae bacterium]
MSRRNALLSFTLLVPFLTTIGHAARPAQLPNEAVEARLRRDVTFLASPECEGRGPTTKGIDRAAGYLAAEFGRIGLKPAGKDGYFQPFALAGGVARLSLTGPDGKALDLKPGADYLALGNDGAGQADAGVVFVGYGVTTKEPAYDDYAGVDVAGKVVVIVRDTPRATAKDRPKEFAAAAPIAAKLAVAKKRGAAAVLFVNDADTASADDVPLDYTYVSVGRGARVPAVSVRRAVIDRLLPAGTTLAAIEKEIDRTLKPASRALTGWTAKLHVERKTDAVALKNVVGVLEGNGPLANETVVVGAHYDHLGYGGPSSLAPGKKRAIHHGADDNASGTTAMLELARQFAAMPQRQGRRLVFVAFSGEELGLFGSAHYCKNPPFPLKDTAAMYNLDMVGRLRKDDKTGQLRLLTEGHGTAAPFKELIDNQAKKRGFTLSSKASGFGPSDHASFAGKKVPVLFVWTGVHPDYHRPTDTADKINLDGMRRIVEMSEEIVTSLTQMPKPAFIEVKGEPTGRPSSGPRLGIRPGYGGDAEGVEVEGVVAGGAADRGGVKEGDRVVGIAGKPVKNLNTYMQAMAVQKAGTTIDVDVIRKGTKVSLKVKLD